MGFELLDGSGRGCKGVCGLLNRERVDTGLFEDELFAW